jgi:hypothetical protein
VKPHILAPADTGGIPKKWLFHFCRDFEVSKELCGATSQNPEKVTLSLFQDSEVTPRSCAAKLDNKKSGETRLTPYALESRKVESAPTGTN